MVGQRPGRGLLAGTEVREEGRLNQGPLQKRSAGTGESAGGPGDVGVRERGLARASGQREEEPLAEMGEGRRTWWWDRCAGSSSGPGSASVVFGAPGLVPGPLTDAVRLWSHHPPDIHASGP